MKPVYLKCEHREPDNKEPDNKGLKPLVRSPIM